MRLVFVLLISVFAVFGQRPCVQKKFPGARTNIVCVCNATYCDDFPPLGTLGDNDFAVYLTTESGQRLNKNVHQFVPTGQVNGGLTFKLDPSQRFQQMNGFGGAFTDAVGINLNKVSKAMQDSILKQYFSPVDGIGYTIGRVPMASCDFSASEYSYDDVENDFDLDHFNLTAADFTLKIPYILRAESLTSSNAALKLFSTPWSAPGWMKSNGHMKGGGYLKGDVNGEYWVTWANYFIRFFEEYAKQGVHFWAVTIQNEPSSGELPSYAWQTMAMTSGMELQFLGQLLGPKLKANDVTKDIKILIYSDQRTGIKDYVKSVMSNADASKYVDGIAYHWYEDFLADASVLSEVHDAYPDCFMLPTEACTGYLPIMRGVSFGDFSRGAQYAHSIIEDIQNYATGWTDWNMVLDEQGGPNWVGNDCDAPVIISNSTTEYYKQPMYYALAHFSKFVRPGSYRISLLDAQNKQPSSPVEAVAFSTTSNQRVVVLNNRYSTAETINIEDASRPGQTAVVAVPAHSILTLVWNKV